MQQQDREGKAADACLAICCPSRQRAKHLNARPADRRHDSRHTMQCLAIDTIKLSKSLYSIGGRRLDVRLRDGLSASRGVFDMPQNSIPGMEEFEASYTMRVVHE